MNLDAKINIEDDFNKLRPLLAEFHHVEAGYIWADFALNLLLSWPLFIYTCFYPNAVTFIISTYFLYRGTMLIHEVVHLSKKLPGYRTAYNLFFGWFSSYPAYIFDGHLYHHGKATYATTNDPEYKFIPSYDFKTLISPIISAFILPLFQTFRFGILPFILPFLSLKYQTFIYQRMSTLVFDINYKRKFRNQKKDLKMMKVNDLICALYKVAIIILIIAEILPIRFITYFYMGFILGSILNMYRALFNHLYTNHSLKALSKKEHVLDTTTIEPGLITSLIFVNGLNYHTLHHLYPEIPYYKLGAAHKKLMRELPKKHIYKKSVYSSIFNLLDYCITKRNNSMQSTNLQI